MILQKAFLKYRVNLVVKGANEEAHQNHALTQDHAPVSHPCRRNSSWSKTVAVC